MTTAIRDWAKQREIWLFGCVLVICILLSFVAPSFFTLANLFDVLTSNAVLGILAAGVFVVLVSGGIDISFMATAAISQYVALTVANAYGGNWLSVLAVACGVGTCLGLVNGLLIHVFKLRSVIVTIATMNVYFGLLEFVTGGRYIDSLPEWFGSGIQWFDVTTADGNEYFLSLQLLVLVSVFVMTWLIMRRLNIGRQIYAMGGSYEAAVRVGINTFRIHLFVYGYMGLLAGLASIVQAQLARTVMPNALVGQELNVLAAVVIGGASLLGGIGGVGGTILGLILVTVVQNGLLLLGVSSYWSLCAVGIVVLVTVSTMSLTDPKTRGWGTA